MRYIVISIVLRSLVKHRYAKFIKNCLHKSHKIQQKKIRLLYK